MAVYYRYRSGVETFSVPVPAPSVTVSELKRLIMGTSRHGHGRTRGRGPREGVALSNAQTGEEYADEGALVLRNSTVVVRRVAGPPAKTIVASSPSSSSSDSAVRSSASAGAEEDDEAKAISAVTDAAELKWEVPSQGARCYGRGVAAANGGAAPPPAWYVCRRCHVAGHFIQHCPTNDDPRFDRGRAPAPTPVPAPAAPAPVPASHDDGRIPPELHCKICKKVMADAVLTSKCCFNSFCDRCIRDHIVASSKCACGARARADDLIPNPAIRVTIDNMLATIAGSGPSGGTEKPRSSVGSNAAAEPTPAASRESHRNHVTSEKAAAGGGSEHSDRNGLSTSKSSTTPAAPKPRTVQVSTTGSTTGPRASHADHHYGYDSVVPFVPACYDPFFGATPWFADPCMYGGGYPMPGPPHHVDAMFITPVSPPPHRDDGDWYGHHDERHGSRKKTGLEDRRHEERSFKRRCGGSRSQVAV